MAHRQHVQEFIDRFRYNANRAASVQSKIKMLEKLYVIVVMGLLLLSHNSKHNLTLLQT